MSTDWIPNVTIVEIITFLIAAGGVAAGLKWIIKPTLAFIRATRLFLDDWTGVEARPGVAGHAGVMQRLACFDRRLEAVEESLADVKRDAAQASFNSMPNHGSSPYDKLVGRLDKIDEHLVEAAKDRASLHAQLDTQRHSRR